MNPAACIETVTHLREQFGVSPLIPQVVACEELLQAGEVVDVAVLGLFKAGKSSFLNAILGEDLLPVDVLPATAAITRIEFGPREQITVHLVSGQVTEIPLSDLAQFVTEQGNPGNEKGVARVDVATPRMAEWRGIRFVDTPGIGSAFTQGSSQKTENKAR